MIIYQAIDYILKKTIKPIISENLPLYMINRWLSMSTIDNAKIVNVTLNRWCFGNNYFTRENFFVDVYRQLLVPFHKRIFYIKKVKTDTKKKKEEVVFTGEYSRRELDLYNQTLEFLNTHNK